jgi:hypothetical protein
MQIICASLYCVFFSETSWNSEVLLNLPDMVLRISNTCLQCRGKEMQFI